MKMNTNYKKIKSYISSIEKYQIKSKELDENNNIENISINFELPLPKGRRFLTKNS